MSDDPTPAGVVTPPAPVTPPPAAATPPVSSPETISLTSEQLKKRLDESATAAQRKFLKGLGFEKDEDLTAAIKRLKDSDQANLTEQEKLRAQLAELEPQARRAAVIEAQYATMVEEQFKALPETVQQAIDSEAEGDAEARQILMSVLKKAGLGAAPAVHPGVTPPASASPSPAPPPSGAPTKFQEWESMKARSPLAGDIFYQQNQREIERTRPAN
jgi:hypothetical protein